MNTHKIAIIGDDNEYCINASKTLTEFGHDVHSIEYPNDFNDFSVFNPDGNIVVGESVLTSEKPPVNTDVDLVLVSLAEGFRIKVDDVLENILTAYPKAKIICEKGTVPRNFPDMRRVFGYYEWTCNKPLTEYIKCIGSHNITNMSFLCGTNAVYGVSNVVFRDSYTCLFNMVSDLMSVLFSNVFGIYPHRVTQIGKATDRHCSFVLTIEDGWKNKQHINMNVFIDPFSLGVDRIGGYDVTEHSSTTPLILINGHPFEWMPSLDKDYISHVFGLPDGRCSYLHRTVIDGLNMVRDSLVFWVSDAVL